MRKSIPAFIAMFFLISCAKTLYYSEDWQTDRIALDGKASEWSKPLRFYDEESGINYTISNDHQNLYFFCSTSNEQMQLKMLRSGIEFAIDTLGKKSFPVSLKYPFGTTTSPEIRRNAPTQTVTNIQPENDVQPVISSQPNPLIPNGSNPKGKVDRTAFKLRLLEEKTDIQLTGFKPNLGKIIPISDMRKTGILAVIDFDKTGTMYYESVIPFSTFYKRELTPSDSNKVFNYRIKINSAPNTNGNQNRGNGMRGGGMRGGMGGRGGMRGGSGGGMRGGMGGGMGGGMRGGMGGGMGGGEMSFNFGGAGGQRSSGGNGMTKIQTKLKLAYR